ncbi:unnamed protein product [Closterium sp. NIES-64]|nr:unnamed protein product [Closterium sp. NIES-64]CAI5994885.1 unnamed protein product [Closterium sp. NIES-64]
MRELGVMRMWQRMARKTERQPTPRPLSLPILPSSQHLTYHHRPCLHQAGSAWHGRRRDNQIHAPSLSPSSHPPSTSPIIIALASIGQAAHGTEDGETTNSTPPLSPHPPILPAPHLSSSPLPPSGRQRMARKTERQHHPHLPPPP